MDRDVCTNNFTLIENEEDSLLWVSAICIVLSLINFIAIWYYFYGMAEHLRKLQRVHDKRVNDLKVSYNLDANDDGKVDHE